MSFQTILIANRGEIACRVIRTARDMGYGTVAVYTAPDTGAPHVAMADQAVLLAEREDGTEPYLSIDAVLDAARKSGADAIHPGYGFLSENAAFSEACDQAGITFIGPEASSIRLMGDKAAGKRAMQDAGVPCVPGYQGDDQSLERLAAEAEKLGTPILIKAVAGGGGRGMRRVDDLADFAEALASARSEALNAFGSDDVILERALDRVRHVEVQVFADTHGNVVHLGERDCSSQRRNQKVIEEAPSPAVDAELRQKLGEAACRVKAIGYRGAGTMEFLMTPDRDFYFIEMNTRLQVEHPVTEEVTGLDLVEWQLRIAAGEKLPLSQDEISLAGASIEARLYAEDPAEGFMPQTGTIGEFDWQDADGVRLDYGVVPGYQLTPRYDPMIAKVITTGSDRAEALRKLVKTLEGLRLTGLTTNKSFLLACARDPEFVSGDFDTGFIDRLLAKPARQADETEIVIAAAIHYFRHCRTYNDQPNDWSTLGPVARQVTFEVAGEEVEFQVRAQGHDIDVAAGRSADFTRISLDLESDVIVAAHISGATRALACWQVDGGTMVDFGALTLAITDPVPDWADAAGGGADNLVIAPMEGRILDVRVTAGDTVSRDQTVCVLEAMKMEHQIKATADGRVTAVMAATGAQAARGEILVELELSEQG